MHAMIKRIYHRVQVIEMSDFYMNKGKAFVGVY